MSTWKPASSLFLGGTEQIKALKGRKVRPQMALQGALVYDPIHNRDDRFTVHAGMIGFVANPHPSRADLLIAFSMTPSSNAGSLDALVRTGTFKVVVVNEPTFKFHFEVEIP